MPSPDNLTSTELVTQALQAGNPAPAPILTITRQGAPVINCAWVVHKTESILVLNLDLASKYCEVIGSSTASVMICANERSLYLHGDRDLFTEVQVPPEYPQFIGASVGRYTITLVFGAAALYKDVGSPPAVRFDPPPGFGEKRATAQTEVAP